MTCATASKQWVIYDAKDQVFLEFTHEQFKDLLNTTGVKLKDIKIWCAKERKKIWIDGILNSDFFK